MNKIFKVIPLIGLSVFTLNSLSSSTQNHLKIDKQDKYKYLFVLGDSLSDQGNLIDMLNTAYGIGKWTHRSLGDPFKNNGFTNGKTAPYYLADKLNIHLEAGADTRLFPFAKPFFRPGKNWAVAGARIAHSPGLKGRFTNLNLFSLAEQMKVIKRHYTIINSEEDLFYINIGSNDLLTAYEEQKQIGPLITEMVEAIYKAHDELFSRGARNIIIANVADLGKTPRFRGKPDQKKMSDLSELFSQRLQEKVVEMQQLNPLFKFYDLKTHFRNLMNEFQQRGPQYKLTNASLFDFGSLVWPGLKRPRFEPGANLDNVDEYFFLDDVHPTKWAHEKVAEKLYELAMQ